MAVGAPAQALEGATSAVNSVAKALKIAKKADRRSKEAASSFGTITKRSDTDVIPGAGTAENGNYETGFNEISCFNDEMAVAGGVDWEGVGGTDDQELWISEFYWLYDATTGQPSGLHVTAGNDTGTNHNLTVEVACLAP